MLFLDTEFFFSVHALDLWSLCSSKNYTNYTNLYAASRVLELNSSLHLVSPILVYTHSA